MRTQLARASLVVALAVAGTHDEAMSTAVGLVDDAEAFRNPVCAVARHCLRAAMSSEMLIPSVRWEHCAADYYDCPRQWATRLTKRTSRPALPALRPYAAIRPAALDYLTLAIRNYHDSGNIVQSARHVEDSRCLFAPG